MKKMVAIILALILCVSLTVLPASAVETDILDQQFRDATGSLDFGYEEYGSLETYMVIRTNRAIFTEAFDDDWDHSDEELVLSAQEYEAVMNRYFVVTQEKLATIRAEGFSDRLTYNAQENTYTVRHPLGFGGALRARSYMGYVTTETGFDVFYGVANYAFLKDALPEGTNVYDYAESLGNPETIEYEGKQYSSSPDGYYCLESVQRSGMKYSLVVDDENVRIRDAAKFTEEECPESFEKLPEVDEDLLTILSDIKDLVVKYGPEIPDEVKNGTKLGTTCDYTPGQNAHLVAIGDDTAYEKDGYVKLLADSLRISYQNLAVKGMLIDGVDAAFLETRTEEIRKADLITLGFSLNGFAAEAVEEVIKDKNEEESYLRWDRYLPQEGVEEVEKILDRMGNYLRENGMTGNIIGIDKADALVVAAESLAFGAMAYTYELPRLINDIRVINPNAQIVIVGMDNPMENASINLSNGDKMSVGVYVDQLISNMDDASQTVAIERENTVFVSAPDAANEYDNNSELTENKLILGYITGVKAEVKPNDQGHAYIRDRIISAMRKQGDVNGDGKTDYSDALLVLRASIGLETLSPEAKAFADVNGDGKSDYSDALKILRASIGLEELEPPEEKPEHTHEWKEATCTEPKTCTTCGVTVGAAKDHEWKEATCTEPKTCAVCGLTEGTAGDHDWKEATCLAPKTCAVCGLTEGTAGDHDWQEATCTAPKKCQACGLTEGKALGHDFVEGLLCIRCGKSNEPTILLPEMPMTVNYSISGELYRSAEITEITAALDNVNLQGEMRYKLTIKGTCTYNKEGNGITGSVYMGYKLLDAEGYVIKSSIVGVDVEVGDKFKTELTLFDLKPGETYQFVLHDVK